MKSLSNLYKQRFVTSEANSTRVINSNQMVADKLEKLRREEEQARLRAARKAMAEEDGTFTEGIVSEETELFTREEAEQLFIQTNEQTEQLLSEARKQAEGIIQNAGIQAEQLKNQAKTLGYEEGLARGKEEAEQIKIKEMQALSEEREAFLEEKEQEFKQLEPKLLDVVLQVVEKVFHIQFQDKKEILEYLILNAIHNIKGCKEFRIHASEDNYPYIASHLKDIRTKVGTEYSIEVLTDASLEENKCVIETDSGMFDCSL